MGFKEIIKGMSDGAEAINQNFKMLSPEYKKITHNPVFEEGFSDGWGGKTKIETVETVNDITININLAIEGAFKNNLWSLTSNFETLASFLKEKSDVIDYGCFGFENSSSLLRFGGVGQGGKGSFHQLNLESGSLHTSASTDNQKNVVSTFQISFKKKQ